jgi:Ca2+-binding EF-hand superfamily protein
MSSKLLPVVLIAFSAPALAQQYGGQQQDPAQAFLQNFDADNDGKVSLQEFKAPQVQSIEEQFRYMDQNQDGALDSAEIAAFHDEMRQRMEQMRQHHGGQ